MCRRYQGYQLTGRLPSHMCKHTIYNISFYIYMYTCTSHPECSTASFGWLAYTQRGRHIVTHYYTPPLFIVMLPWVGALFPIAPDLSLAPVIRFALSSPATGTFPFTVVESIHTVAESWGMILLSLGGGGGGGGGGGCYTW